VKACRLNDRAVVGFSAGAESFPGASEKAKPINFGLRLTSLGRVKRMKHDLPRNHLHLAPVYILIVGTASTTRKCCKCDEEIGWQRAGSRLG